MLKSAFIALLLTASPIAIASPVMAQTAAVKPVATLVDPVRLKLAEQTVAKLIPPGTYKKIMKDMMDTMAGGIVEQMMGMDAAVIAGMAGEEAGSETAKAVEGKSLGDLAAEKDPQFKERMDITMKVMFAEMGDLMSEMEPVVRTAMSSIYARKYSAKELTDMNVFFATPSGASFAANFMSSFTDKEMIDASFGMMPKMMEAMPAIMKKVEAATAHLPPMPVSPDETQMAMDSAADAVTDAAVAIPFADETGEEPWYVEENWAPAARKRVKALEAKYGPLGAKSEAAGAKAGEAYARFEEAQSAATDEARKRYVADGWKPMPVAEPMAAEDIPADAVPPPAAPK
jgi:hypothetical protein